jgi:hypothetical protein
MSSPSRRRSIAGLMPRQHHTLTLSFNHLHLNHHIPPYHYPPYSYPPPSVSGSSGAHAPPPYPYPPPPPPVSDSSGANAPPPYLYPSPPPYGYPPYSYPPPPTGGSSGVLLLNHTHTLHLRHIHTLRLKLFTPEVMTTQVKSVSVSRQPLELIFSDVCGPPPDSIGRNK